MNRYLVFLSLFIISIALIEVSESARAGRRYESYMWNGRRPSWRWGGYRRMFYPSRQNWVNRMKVRDQMIQKLCENSSLADTFVSQVRKLISDLRASGKYTAAFSANAAIVAYIENEENAKMIQSNCIGFFDGLKGLFAKSRVRGRIVGRRFRRIIRREVFNILRSLVKPA